MLALTKKCFSFFKSLDIPFSPGIRLLTLSLSLSFCFFPCTHKCGWPTLGLFAAAAQLFHNAHASVHMFYCNEHTTHHTHRQINKDAIPRDILDHPDTFLTIAKWTNLLLVIGDRRNRLTCYTAMASSILFVGLSKSNNIGLASASWYDCTAYCFVLSETAHEYFKEKLLYVCCQTSVDQSKKVQS